MTEQALYPEAKQNDRNTRVSALISFTSVFIAFAVLAAILFICIPSLRDIADVPTKPVGADYKYSDAKQLLSDAFSLSLPQHFAVLAMMLAAFSVLSDFVSLTVVAYKGFSAGAVIFAVICNHYPARQAFIFLLYWFIQSAIIICSAAYFGIAHINIFRSSRTSNKRRLFYDSVSVLFITCIMAGAICLISAISLITL